MKRLAIATTTLLSLSVALITSPVAGARGAQDCSSGHGSVRDVLNPLDLPVAPGANPLNGARFFVDGPYKGLAAGAIAQALGRDPASFGDESWADFSDSVFVRRGRTARSSQARGVQLLSKIASQPETKWFSPYTRGGVPGALFSSARDFLCRMRKTDPGAVPLMMTYLLKHSGYCPTLRETGSDQAVFRRRIDELASAIGNFPFVMFAEMDAIDASGCLSHAGLADRIKLLKYEVDKFASLPHGVVYVEGGTEDANSVAFAVKMLKAIDVGRIRGFFLNETHYQWTSTEITYGTKVSRLTHGTHFVIDTRANGNGPFVNPHPVQQGNENLCNPPGRGLGPPPSTNTGVKLVDAYEWVSTPGRSSGPCHPGDPPPGLFGASVAIPLAAHANNRVGPGSPSRPY